MFAWRILLHVHPPASGSPYLRRALSSAATRLAATTSSRCSTRSPVRRTSHHALAESASSSARIAVGTFTARAGVVEGSPNAPGAGRAPFASSSSSSHVRMDSSRIASSNSTARVSSRV